jgi:putative two-component system response regulator
MADILVVDDDVVSARILKKIIESDGLRVDVAHNGRLAMEMLHRGNYRIVVSDWDMPEMDGEQLCREIRSGTFHRYIYFILVTASRNTDTATGLRSGADDFLNKPVNADELRMRIRTGQRIVAMETIFAMAKLAEMRDTETGRHVERVAMYSRALTRHLGTLPKFSQQLTPAVQTLIYQTSPLHDIGKVAIPDAILLKNQRLTPEEFEVMKSHTKLGAQTLEAAIEAYPEASFLAMARDIAISHHERWDGGGYPNRLSGNDIPLAGRIVALADVYDALTSDRPYKRAYTHDAAKAMIVADSGKHFDPDVVGAFLNVEAEFIDVHTRFGDGQSATRQHVKAA